MKPFKSLKPGTVKFVLLLNILFLTGYSIFIYLYDDSLLINSIASKSIFFEYIAWKVIAGILFFISSILILRNVLESRWVWWIIAGGLIVRIILIPAFPVVENDFYRYMWDGAVTANGINPYKYSPEDALKVNPEIEMPEVMNRLAMESGDIINGINHPHIRTIYPPMAQLIFALSYFLFPWKIWGLKLLFLILDGISLFLFLKILKKTKKPFIFLFFYWMNPIVIHEFYAGAHMDIIIIPFLLMILLFVINNKNSFASLLIPLAAGVKIWPVIYIPLAFRNLWDNKKKLLLHLTITASLILLIFTPVFVTVFDRSLGFVVYAQSWTNNDAVFSILLAIIKEIRAVLPIHSVSSFALTRWITGFLYLTFLFIVSRRPLKNAEDYFTRFLLIAAVLFFISPTQFPWYFTWVIPFLVFRPMISLLLYPVLLPLYQLNYISPYIVFIQHLPILALFIYELKNKNLYKYIRLHEYESK